MLPRALDPTHRNRRATAVWLGLALAFFVAMPASADFETGYEAYKARDYQREELRPLVEAGDRMAQASSDLPGPRQADSRARLNAALLLNNHEAAREILLPMAEAGDEWAKTMLKLVELALARQIEKLERVHGDPQLARGILAFDNRDFKRASTILAPLAQAGNAKALYYVGRILERSDDPREKEEASAHFTQAARKGYPDAQVGLADSILETEDEGAPILSFGWVVVAAGLNSPDAYLRLSGYYCGNPGDLPLDPMLANAWLALRSPDIAMGKPAEALETNWEEVKSHWETFGCGLPTNVTPDFVREVHRRAQALITAFDIQACTYDRYCDDVVPKWDPNETPGFGTQDPGEGN